MKFNNLITKIMFSIILSISANAMDPDESVNPTKPKKHSVCFWNTFIYSIEVINTSTSSESRVRMEKKTLQMVKTAIEIDDVTQDELDYVFNASLVHGLLKMTEYLLTLPGYSPKKPTQHIIDKAVRAMFDPLTDARYCTKVSNLFMQVASSQVGSYMEINSALKSINKT